MRREMPSSSSTCSTATITSERRRLGSAGPHLTPHAARAMFKSPASGYVRPRISGPKGQPSGGMLMSLRAGVLTAASVAALLVASGSASLPASAGMLRQTVNDLPKQAVAVGTGGAGASDDGEATSAGLEGLRPGGNAIAAAGAVGGAPGVAHP